MILVNFLILSIIILIILRYLDNKGNRVTNIFEKYFNDKSYKVLDFGCGACCNSTKLTKMGHNVTSLDVVNLGKCTTPQLYDGNKIPFEDNSFDIVVCSFVLHHAKNWPKLLKELKRVGKVIIIIENTPEIKLDYYLINKHSDSHWGQCSNCFLNSKQWIKEFESIQLDIKLIERIPRWYYPFSDKPWIYPVPSTIFILSKK